MKKAILGLGSAFLMLGSIQSAAHAISLTGSTININGNDIGIVTEDNTGKEWIRLDEVGFRVSPDAALNDTRWTGAGFRVATIPDVNGLVEAFFMASPAPFVVDADGGPSYTPQTGEPTTDDWRALFGQCGSICRGIPAVSRSYFNDGNGFDWFGAGARSSRNSFIFFDLNANSDRLANSSVFLVRDSADVPTPALLPGLIGMGVAAIRKRKKENA
ncbi:MAG: PTPA-CTERM sorting domain-containing protein [Cyanobacteria bacterium P01_D01_bin.105]